MTTPDYKSIALRLYGYGKFAEDYGYREEYWSQLRAIGAELGVADIENPEDLGIPWPPTTAVQCERPASCKLLTHDHPATDRAMTQDYNYPPTPGQHFRVRFTPRPSHDGRELMPDLQEHIGAELLVRSLWQMDDSDPYPGEWAMGNADCHSDLLGRAWIASGDLTIAPPEPTLAELAV